MIKVMPSMLSADHASLEKEAGRAAGWGADALHLDIMELAAVGDIGFSPRSLQAVARSCSLPMEIHMMLTDYEKGLALFRGCRMDSLTLQYETAAQPARLLAAAGTCAKETGIALAPDTQPEEAEELLSLCGRVLLMGVEPGKAGAHFREEVLDKIRRIRTWENLHRLKRPGRERIKIMVDGGLTLDSAVRCARAGADGLVVGTALFGSADPAAWIRTLKAKGGEKDDLLQ